jgi:hypothetical protein
MNVAEAMNGVGGAGDGIAKRGRLLYVANTITIMTHVGYGTQNSYSNSGFYMDRIKFFSSTPSQRAADVAEPGGTINFREGTCHNVVNPTAGYPPISGLVEPHVKAAADDSVTLRYLPQAVTLRPAGAMDLGFRGLMAGGRWVPATDGDPIRIFHSAKGVHCGPGHNGTESVFDSDTVYWAKFF